MTLQQCHFDLFFVVLEPLPSLVQTVSAEAAGFLKRCYWKFMVSIESYQLWVQSTGSSGLAAICSVSCRLYSFLRLVQLEDFRFVFNAIVVPADKRHMFETTDCSASTRKSHFLLPFTVQKRAVVGQGRDDVFNSSSVMENQEVG